MHFNAQLLAILAPVVLAIAAAPNTGGDVPALDIKYSEQGKTCQSVTFNDEVAQLNAKWKFVADVANPPATLPTTFDCAGHIATKTANDLYWLTGTLEAVGLIAGTHLKIPAYQDEGKVYACVQRASFDGGVCFPLD